MTSSQLIIAILFFGALVGIYILVYLANKRTPLPPGCENLKPDCEACKDVHCINNPEYRK